jgi:hypothetical protein
MDEATKPSEAAHQPARIEDQPPPTPNDQPAVWGLVIADMHERDQVGRERYGTPLQPHNGRDALVDAYQEALDLVVYLRQALAERDDWKARAEKWESRYRLVRKSQAKLTRRLDRIRAEARNASDMDPVGNSTSTRTLDRIVQIIDGADEVEDGGQST